MPVDRRRRPRLSSGFRVPAEGTISYEIYLLMSHGMSQRHIAEVLKKRYAVVRNLVYMMRHPDYCNSVRTRLRWRADARKGGSRG